ncbi:hypothetical protein [Enterovibrio nigricans]|uniref:Uncharacterized protein n=1 Tax=Enterovibrio nigricans DSM 22720 TaxID=1121868 RepID=A0A1T4UVB2_9GAMM|nr:hypothetical protein [Enterovibrio nigricans]PKF50910.1 hypothetical protein AT251_07770 [Enterovibrio nigricans]SKA56576.1 hypothetical protein SAMN02745132_02589 [Enterovibrio nigricans DSM 22720]
MAHARKFRIDPQYELLNPTSEEEVEALLLEMYPDNRIAAQTLYEVMTPADIAIIKCDLGVGRNWYTPKEIAHYFWLKGNYYASESNPFG